MNWWFRDLGISNSDEWFYENVDLTYEFYRRKKKKKKGILGILKKAVENKETTSFCHHLMVMNPWGLYALTSGHFT